VHCNEIYPNPYAVRACASAGEGGRRIPVVTHMRLSATPRMIRNYDLDRADRIVVPSAKAGQDFDIWPDKEERVRVIHNGVDLTDFRRTRSPIEARRQIGLAGEGQWLAVIGQIGPRKAGDVILRAFGRIVSEFPEARLMFVGNPHRGQEAFAEELRRESERPPLAGRVFFFPFTQRILTHYEAADVNLLVSRDEGFGRTIIEAGALGVPSIGSRVGGIPELIDEGHTGLLVNVDDDADLAEAMRTMLANETLRRAMGDTAFRHVAQNFSIRTHAEKMMGLYDSLMAPV
jgi:glycosyltransferase involved in cell wall biosynthesis